MGDCNEFATYSKPSKVVESVKIRTKEAIEDM